MFSETQQIWILIPTADTDAYLSLRSTVLEGSTQDPPPNAISPWSEGTRAEREWRLKSQSTSAGCLLDHNFPYHN